MKVERNRQNVFEPIIITLETKLEANYMDTIARVQTNETLRDACEKMKQPLADVDHFGANLTRALDKFLDC